MGISNEKPLPFAVAGAFTLRLFFTAQHLEIVFVLLFVLIVILIVVLRTVLAVAVFRIVLAVTVLRIVLAVVFGVFTGTKTIVVLVFVIIVRHNKALLIVFWLRN